MTLIEILIVISILGVLIGLVSINLQSDQRQNRTSAEQLTARINHATLLATLRGNPMGLSLSTQGYEFWQLARHNRTSTENVNPQWLLADQRGLGRHQLKANQQFQLQLDQTTIALKQTLPTGPQLFFPASGELPDFLISLNNGPNSHGFRVTADPSRFQAIITSDTGTTLAASATEPGP